MSLLEHPDAVALLADAEVSAADVRGCRRRLERFLRRYLPRFYRIEQHELARVVLQGKLSNLQRKTSEPIAYLAGRQRKPVQHFVGAGAWDDESVMAELRRHVAEERGDPDAVPVLDPKWLRQDGRGLLRRGPAGRGGAARHGAVVHAGGAGEAVDVSGDGGSAGVFEFGEVRGGTAESSSRIIPD